MQEENSKTEERTLETIQTDTQNERGWNHINWPTLRRVEVPKREEKLQHLLKYNDSNSSSLIKYITHTPRNLINSKQIKAKQ